MLIGYIFEKDGKIKIAENHKDFDSYVSLEYNHLYTVDLLRLVEHLHNDCTDEDIVQIIRDLSVKKF